jgi:DNA-binding MarR family transcriptional regulator
VARYEVSQARPVTIRDIYRRLRLDKNLVEETVRELADMGFLHVERMTANNRLKVITIRTTEAGEAWIAH